MTGSIRETWFDPVIGFTADVNDDVNALVTLSELRGSRAPI